MAGSHEVRGSIPLCSTTILKVRLSADLFLRCKRNDAARDFDGTGKFQRGRHGAKANACPFSIPLHLPGSRPLIYWRMPLPFIFLILLAIPFLIGPLYSLKEGNCRNG